MIWKVPKDMRNMKNQRGEVLTDKENFDEENL